MHQVAYSNHIGRTAHDKKSKSTALSTAADLAAAEKHNNHDYTQDDIERLASKIDLSLKQYNVQFDRNLEEVDYLDLMKTVKELYQEEFSGAIEKYNESQIQKGHSERQIRDYFEQISKNQKQEVAVEGIIQFGELDDWKGKSLEEKQLTLPMYLKVLRKMDEELSGFKLAGASFHINEGSPHLHYVGICVDESKKKTGLEKRIGKSAVFERDTMSEFLQDELRAYILPDMQKTFGWEWKDKRSGRNDDLKKNEYVNYKLQEQARNAQERLTELDSVILGAEDELDGLKAEIDAQRANRGMIVDVSDIEPKAVPFSKDRVSITRDEFELLRTGALKAPAIENENIDLRVELNNRAYQEQQKQNTINQLCWQLDQERKKRIAEEIAARNAEQMIDYLEHRGIDRFHEDGTPKSGLYMMLESIATIAFDLHPEVSEEEAARIQKDEYERAMDWLESNKPKKKKEKSNELNR